jgi:competence protein ComEC
MNVRRGSCLPLAIGFSAGAALPGHGPALLAAVATSCLALFPPLAPLAFAMAGWAVAAAISPAPATQPHSSAEVILDGRVSSVPERLDDHQRFLLRSRDGRLLLATSPAPPYPLALWDRIRLSARLRRPEGARNPGGRDRAGELAAKGVALEAHASTPPVRVAPPSPFARLEDGRSRFASLASRALPPREAALVRAIGAGDRGAIDPATADAFARSGLAHLLSVSGLHLAVVALGLWKSCRFALARWDALAARHDPARIAAAATLPVTVLYALATGADVPVVRSAVAAALALGGVLLQRETDALTAVSVAAIAILAAEPGARLDPSFQLSFASVAGLALFTRPLREAIPLPRETHRLLGRAREMLLSAACASAAATVATAPIVALHFRRLSLFALASNVVGVPVGSALTVTAALAAAASALSPALAAPALWACHPLAYLLLALNDLFARPSWSAVAVGSPGPVGLTLAYLALLAAWRLRGRARWLAAAAAAAALILPAPLRHALALRRGGLEVTFLSVGQGDATAFLLPDGTAAIVDGGGDPRGRVDPGARDVVPWLRDAGIRRISALFLSHPHPDHLGGLPSIAAAFPVERFFSNGRVGDEMAAAALARLPPATRLRPGEVFERAGVRFEALGPPDGSEAWTENDASLVLRVTYGESVFLMCGDIEAEGEAALVAAAGGRLRADVVKIPHHGSATSSGLALVAAVAPRFAIATVGAGNRFGFPSPEIVARWRASGAALLRTDEGAIRFLSDGGSVRHTPAESSLDALALAKEAL